MPVSGKRLHLLLAAGFAICLLYIWAPGYFLTGDGPCHVYNARVVHDFWTNRDVAFYSRFYKLVYEPNPNWLATFLMAALMFLVNGIVAEKIFLTAYILLYAAGFYLLIRKLSG